MELIQKEEGVAVRNDKQEQAIRSSAAEYLTFVAATGDSTESMEMRYEDENIWLTQKMMSALYDVDVRTINEHIQNIYAYAELTEETTIRNFRIVQTEGSRQANRQIKHYNLQMIIAVASRSTMTGPSSSASGLTALSRITPSKVGPWTVTV